MYKRGLNPLRNKDRSYPTLPFVPKLLKVSFTFLKTYCLVIIVHCLYLSKEAWLLVFRNIFIQLTSIADIVTLNPIIKEWAHILLCEVRIVVAARCESIDCRAVDNIWAIRL